MELGATSFDVGISTSQRGASAPLTWEQQSTAIKQPHAGLLRDLSGRQTIVVQMTIDMNDE